MLLRIHEDSSFSSHWSFVTMGHFQADYFREDDFAVLMLLLSAVLWRRNEHDSFGPFV